ncbi:hypothetical protein ONZ45_g9731 [Pleurotus djamor]|nr:hypothetical protein ONZ45_g9731 [Pleurotus djamor]
MFLSKTAMITPHLNEDSIRYLIEFIPLRKDLLALGLTHSRNLSLVKSGLAHRVIRSYLDNKALWNYFTLHPEHAAEVYELEILRENPGAAPYHAERVPVPELFDVETGAKESSRAELEASENLLIEAVRRMVNLKTFIWDRWVPLVNAQKVDEQDAIVGEDIWTTLRDYTQLKELTIVDLGTYKILFDNVQPIFRSLTAFTLGSLTQFSLKVYYSPVDPYEGFIESDDDDSGGENAEETTKLLPPRIDLTTLKALLLGSPQLQSLSLQIFDRKFYYDFDGNPYSDITPILAEARWPNLQHLCFWDITIESNTALSFLERHPTIRSISCHLSMCGNDSLPQLPFDLPNITSVPNSQLLPNIEELDLPANSIQQLAPSLRSCTSLQRIGVLEPYNWCGSSEGSDPGFDFDDGRQMPQLREVTLTLLRTFEQLEILVNAAPNIETLRVYTNLIPEAVRYLAHRDRYLHSLTGIHRT